MPVKTIYDIARHLGINPSTVSRALRDDSRVKEKTRQRVKEFAREVGYTPNSNARNLASGRTRSFWLLVPGLFSDPEREIARELSQFFGDRDFDLMILSYQNDPQMFRRLISRLEQNVADGAFVVGPRNEGGFTTAFSVLNELEIPVFFLIRGPEGLDLQRHFFDEITASNELMNRVVQCGADTFIVGFDSDNTADRLRRETVLSCIKKNGYRFVSAGNIYELNPDDMKKKHLAYLTSSSSEISEFTDRHFARYPESCSLTAGVFDEWRGPESPMKNIIVCRLEYAKVAHNAALSMLRLLDNDGLVRKNRLSRLKSYDFVYEKYESINVRRNEGMSMRWNLGIIGAVLLLMSAVAFFWSPPATVGKKIPLVWVTDPNPQRDGQVEAFNKMNPDLNLRIDPDNTGAMKVVVQCSAGMGSDIIGGVGDTSYQIYKDSGILWDVTEQAEKMGFGPETLPETVRPLVMYKTLDKNGNFVERQYVYPCNVYHVYIIYNKNLFDKYGVSYPDGDVTWEEFITIAKKLTIRKNKNDAVPEVFGLMGTNLVSLIWAKGGELINKAGTRSGLASDQVVAAAKFYHDIFYKYGIEPSPDQRTAMTSQGGWGGTGGITFLANGKVAMTWGARYNLIQFRRIVREQERVRAEFLKKYPDKKDEAPEVTRLGACLVPRFKGKKRYTMFGARCAGINVKSKHREEALKFLQYLASSEYCRQINMGADSKPGPVKYNSMKHYINPDFKGEEDIHRVSLESVPFGRTYRRSPFISISQIRRIVDKVQQKLIATPEITEEEIREICKRASDKIDEIIARSISRNNKLRKLYLKMLENGAEPVRLDLEEVE